MRPSSSSAATSTTAPKPTQPTARAWPRRWVFEGLWKSIMQKLSGKVAVITGGNSSIGLAYAQPLAEESGRGVNVGRRQDAVGTALAGIGPEAMGFVGDVAEPMARAHAVLRISGHAFWRHLFRGVSTR